VWSVQWIPTVVNLGFLDRSRYFFLRVAPQEAEWTPFQTHCFSENLEAPGIEPRTSGSLNLLHEADNRVERGRLCKLKKN
jgi:hypothetical protein